MTKRKIFKTGDIVKVNLGSKDILCDRMPMLLYDCTFIVTNTYKNSISEIRCIEHPGYTYDFQNWYLNKAKD